LYDDIDDDDDDKNNNNNNTQSRQSGPINVVGLEFIIDLAHRISRVTDDPRETSFLFQRILVAIQRFNTVIFSNSSATPMTTPQAFRSTPIEFNFC